MQVPYQLCPATRNESQTTERLIAPSGINTLVLALHIKISSSKSIPNPSPTLLHEIFHSYCLTRKLPQRARILNPTLVSLLLILVPANIRRIVREAHRLELRRVVLAHARRQARDNLISVRCDEVRNREACTRHRFRRLTRRGSDDWRGKRDAVACGWEDICAISACVVFRLLEGQLGRWGRGRGGGGSVPLLNLWSMSPMLRAKAP